VQFGLREINRAHEGISRSHGRAYCLARYAAIIHVRPSGLFLLPSSNSAAERRSRSRRRSQTSTARAKGLRARKIILGS